MLTGQTLQIVEDDVEKCPGAQRIAHPDSSDVALVTVPALPAGHSEQPVAIAWEYLPALHIEQNVA